MSHYKSDYAYPLPEELIAKNPVTPRSASRMMIVNREKNFREHNQFENLPDLLPEKSLLVVNNTRVIPARLLGKRKTGAQVEVLMAEELKEGVWKCKIKNLKKIKIEETFSLCNDSLQATLKEIDSQGMGVLEFSEKERLFTLLEQKAYAPIPPYIHKVRKKGGDQREGDLQDYQTAFADHYGAVAAPTAGLHFTPEIIGKIRERNISIVEVTLHVGLGTFSPVRVEEIREHQMHKETAIISEDAAEQINQAKASGKTLIAVGTTSVRTLESSFHNNRIHPGKRETSIFIYPPYRFQVVDQLITNFHLPESTLMMLVSAFAGREFILESYENAIAEKYRFLSYGDCMWIQ